MKIKLIMAFVLLFLIQLSTGVTAENTETEKTTTPAAGDEISVDTFRGRITPITANTSSSQDSNMEYSKVWEAIEECACVPDISFINYGFYTMNPPNKSNKVDFGVFSNIALYALTPDSAGNLDIPPEWNIESFTQVSQKFTSKLDLVVKVDEWCEDVVKCDSLKASDSKQLKFQESYVLQNLIDEIVEKAREIGVSGVTIDFQNIPSTLYERYLFLIKRLSKRLKDETEQGIKLNVVLSDFQNLDLKNAGKISNLIALAELQPSIQYFLLVLPNLTFSGSQSDIPKKTVIALTQYLLETGLQTKKLVIVMDSGTKEFANYHTAVKQGFFRGVGIWDTGAGPDGWQEVLPQKVKQSLVSGDNSYLTKLTAKDLVATACKTICPNRNLLTAVLYSVSGVLVALLLISLVFYEIRKILNRFAMIFWIVGTLTLVLLYALLICVPDWEKFQLPTTLGLLLAGMMWIVKYAFDKRREADYP